MNKWILRVNVTVLVLLSISLSLLSGCTFGVGPYSRLSGNGTVATKEESLSASEYKLIVKDIHFTNHKAVLTIDETLDNQVILATDENILDTISIIVDEEAKLIQVKGSKKYRYNFTSLNITVGSPVNSVQIDGGFSVDFNLPSVTDFDMVINGAISGNLSFGDLSTLSMEINGASNLTLSGTCASNTAIISGASNIQAFDLVTEDSAIEISGASSYEVHVTGILDATISGVGSITYSGSPTKINRDISGLGVVKQR